MIERRIHGKSIAQIAQEFNVSHDTVTRTLSWAKKAELVVEMEDKILQELLPAAKTAITEVLAGSNDEVRAKTAIRIFESALPSFTKTTKSPGAPTSNESDLGSYIASLRDAAQQLEGVVDGEVSPARTLTGGAEGKTQLALPPATETVTEEGLPVPSEGAESAVDAPGNTGDGD
jgi:hypothetical protein